MILVFAGITFLVGVGLTAVTAKAAWHNGHEIGYRSRGEVERREAQAKAPGPYSEERDARWPDLPDGGVWGIASHEDGLDEYILQLTPGAAENLKIDEVGRPSREGRPLRIEFVPAKGWPVAMFAQPDRGRRYE